MGVISVLLLMFLYIQTIKFSFCSADSSSSVACIQRERQALLSFKQSLVDPSNRLSSWTGEDCCKWTGVFCDNITGHVLELHLQNPSHGYETKEEAEDYILGGKINSSLLELKHLNYLDLSLNDFGGIHIPKFFGSLRSLRYLNLSEAGFGGMIPHQLGNLSSLCYLDLRSDGYSFSAELKVENLQWLSRLSSLQHLDMSEVYIGEAYDWLQVINMLPSLLELHLSACGLDEIPPLPYVNFTSLIFLDLSKNHFNSSIPEWLSSLTSLVYLGLGLNDFQGPIPGAVRNMTTLKFLSLYSNNFDSTIPCWLYDLSSLEVLNLGDNYFQGPILSAVGNLTSLTRLHMFGNGLEGNLPRTLGNLRNLRELDLSYNKLGGEISGFLQNSSRSIMDSLEYLNLEQNELSGNLPDQLGQLKNLGFLYLSFNSFSGLIPASLGRLSSLQVLDIGSNQLSGTVPESLGHLSKLEILIISNNSLEGIVSEAQFANLKKLQRLYADSNLLVLKVSSDWIPPFQLKVMRMGTWQLGPKFPSWLQTQKDIAYLDLSSTGISDAIPTWFWNLASYQLTHLDLSHNQIHGAIPSPLKFDDFRAVIYLGSNHFEGPLPRLSSNVKELDLSNNSFSGDLSLFLCDRKDEEISLEILDLSKNLLSGELPDCWTNWQLLRVVRLGNNNITGNIPSSMGSLTWLKSLHLHNNSLFGELHSSLQNCTKLQSVDLGENEFSGSIPTWIGKSLSKLIAFGIRSNKFNGDIPPELCHFSSLQILDLAHNNLSGSIPQCFNNFSAMAKKQNSNVSITYALYSEEFPETAVLVTKGREFEYSYTLTLVTSMDLSSNSLSGVIPEELTSLLGLRSLNLSRNRLRGEIPEKIGNMILLESIDFSTNQLSGVIPQSMSNLTFLSHLNLSYNRLSGRIPSSTQIQSLNSDSFISNQELCGPPLTKNCTGDEGAMPEDDSGKDDNGFDMESFLVSMELGFVVGFWGVCGFFLFKKSWRYAYFRFLDDMIYKFRGSNK